MQRRIWEFALRRILTILTENNKKKWWFYHQKVCLSGCVMELHKWLRKWVKYAHWKLLGSQAIQDIPERINHSYEAFFDHLKSGRNGRKSPPKYCKRQNYSSFTLKQADYKFHEDNRVTVMGRIYKYVKHRPLGCIPPWASFWSRDDRTLQSGHPEYEYCFLCWWT